MKSALQLWRQEQTTVAPLAGAWIEICIFGGSKEIKPSSLPSRERGLKSSDHGEVWGSLDVAPLAGAWIEMAVFARIRVTAPVAPLAGAWIEI